MSDYWKEGLIFLFLNLQSNRKTWDIDLDISAPQIIFVEHFCDKNAVIVVVDFGRLHFTNYVDAESNNTSIKKDSDDEGN